MLRPIGDNIIGLPIDVKKKNQSIILVNEETTKTSDVVLVVAVGEGRATENGYIPVGIKAHQKVVIPKYAGTVIEDNDDSYIVFKEQDIIAVVEDE